MTGGTHIAIGIASSLAILQPKTISQCLCAATGGMIGGMISDIDHPKKRASINYKDDPYGWQIYTFWGIALTVLLALDFFEGNGVIEFCISNFSPSLVVGAVAFLGLCFYGTTTFHRTFTHSIAAGVLFTLSIWCFCRPLAIPFAIGFSSHLVIDYLNKRKCQYFWPLKGSFGLNKYPSDGKLNDFLFASGTIGTIYLFTYSFIQSFGSSVIHAKLLAVFSEPASFFGIINVPFIVLYLIIINIVTFFIYVLDYYMCLHCIGFYRVPSKYDGQKKDDWSAIETHLDSMEGFMHTILLAFDICGGMIGKLVAVTILLKGKVYKDKWRANFNLYIIPICILICWVMIVVTFFLPETTSWGRRLVNIRIGSMPIQNIVLGYFLIINIVAFAVLPRVQRFAGLVITPRERVCVILCLLGGASGGLLSLKTTGKHENASMLSDTLPTMIIMHTVVVVCTLLVQ